MFATYEEAMEWIHTRKGMGPCRNSPDEMVDGKTGSPGT